MRGTMGVVQPHPGAINVIPGRVIATVDLRNPESAPMARAEAAIREYSGSLTDLHGVSITWRQTAKTDTVPFDAAVQECIANTADALGLSRHHLIAGAGHDARSGRASVRPRWYSCRRRRRDQPQPARTLDQPAVCRRGECLAALPAGIGERVMSIVRAAMTETKNAYPGMPATVEELGQLTDQLEAIRRANVEHHAELVAAAHAQGATMIGLGELFPAPYFALHRDAFFRGLAEDAVDGPTIQAVREWAQAHAMVIIAPIYEQDGERRFNTAVVVDADGAIVGRYRKAHIPAGRNEQNSFDETFYYQRSDDEDLHPVFETAVGRIGVAICYDRHFEGMVSGLARAGAQIVFSPAVTFGAHSERMWELEFAVDAARHRVFIGGANRRGSEPPWHQEFFGRSHFVGPDGPLENRSDRSALVVADLDLAQLSAPSGSGWDLRRDARIGP